MSGHSSRRSNVTTRTVCPCVSNKISTALVTVGYLGIWSKPGAGFVCIEPWQGYASPENFDGELKDKPGMALVPPGMTKRFEIAIGVFEGAAPGHRT
jgi:galactose mutarotase-like enzyme